MNRQITKPTMKDLVDLIIKQVMLSLNCVTVATVKGFDEETQRITAEINYKQTYLRTLDDGSAEEYYVAYPILASVPVVSLCGGLSSLSFPIAVNDQCVILFADRDISNWVKSRAAFGRPDSERLHSLSDGLAIVGLNFISDYDTERVLIKNDTAMVGVGPEKVLVENNTGTLFDKLDALVDAIKNITVAPGSFSNSGGPVTGFGSVSPASQTALDSAIGDIEDLLE